MGKKISRIARTILQRNSKSGEFTSNLKLLQSYTIVRKCVMYINIHTDINIFRYTENYNFKKSRSITL